MRNILKGNILPLLILVSLLTACNSNQNSLSNKVIDEGNDTSNEIIAETALTPIDTPTPTLIKLGGGGLIVFETRNGGRSILHLVNPNGDDLKSINNSSGYLATWSPSGEQIAFVKVGNNSVNDLFVIDKDGSNLNRLTNTPFEEGIPAWSPFEDVIAISWEVEGYSQIFLMDAISGEIIQKLTEDDGKNHYMPAWSPDGSQIAYVVETLDDRDSSEIYIMDINGENVQQLTDNNILDFYPAWSPDGSQLAFVSEQSGISQINIMEINEEIVNPLTSRLDGASRPAWSPDGSMIAFHSFHDGLFSIYTISISSGEEILLVEGAAHPAWSSGD